MKMKEKTKNKIYNLLHDFNPDGRIAGGIVAFLETEDNATIPPAILPSGLKSCSKL